MAGDCTILLVESNEADQQFACKAIKKAGVPCSIRIACDGGEACELLFNSDEPVPQLILLDLDLPRIDGFHLLEMIRGRSTTRRIPVIVLASLKDRADLIRCFDLAANSFVRKDRQDLETYESRLKLLLYYWTAVNEPCT